MCLFLETVWGCNCDFDFPYFLGLWTPPRPPVFLSSTVRGSTSRDPSRVLGFRESLHSYMESPSLTVLNPGVFFRLRSMGPRKFGAVTQTYNKVHTTT